MRLIELNPRWITLHNWAVTVYIGVTFQCPHCENQRLCVGFTPPIFGKDAEAVMNGIGQEWEDRWNPMSPLWQRTGEKFENMTLTPSVNADISIDGHWHGFIRNGEVS